MDLSSSQLFQRSLHVVPGGVHSPVRSFKGLHRTPLFIKEAKGAYLSDIEGNRYLDFCMSFGPLILGHRDDDVAMAIAQACERGWSYGACEPYSLALAEYLVRELPFIDQIRFVNSGTEAVMTALRLARAATKKDKVLKFNGCYHGHLDALLVQSGSGLAGQSSATSLGLTAAHVANTAVCDLDRLDQVEEILAQQGHEIAVVALEPLPANYGLLPQRLEFLQGLRELTKKYGVMLLFDEVISGFRCSFGGMTALTGIEPDLWCYGKIIGGGFPVGAVAGKRHIMEHLAPLGGVYQAGTLSANPVAMSAGLATLQKLNTPQHYQQLTQTTEHIVELFTRWLKQHPHPHINQLKIQQHSSLFWFYPAKEIGDDHHAPRSLVDLEGRDLGASFYVLFEELLKRGIYLAPNGYEVGFVSLAHHRPEVLKDLRSRLELSP